MSYPGCAFRIQVLPGCFPSYDIPEPDLEFPRHGAEEGSASHLEDGGPQRISSLICCCEPNYFSLLHPETLCYIARGQSLFELQDPRLRKRVVGCHERIETISCLSPLLAKFFEEAILGTRGSCLQSNRFQD